MKTRRKLFLAVIICAFGAAYTAVLLRPLPQAMAVSQYCPPAYPSCAIPVASIGQMLQ